jgi:large subunit ribosomal protein L21
MFAVVQISGKQYKVKKGDIVTVDKVEGDVGTTLTLPDVFLVSDAGKTKVGSPKVAGVVVTAKVVVQEKGEKVEVRRFKSKVRYRKHVGFRPMQTKLEITAIG